MTRSKKCGCCDEGFSRGEACIDCSACRKSHHDKCSKLSDDEFLLMQSNKSSLKWFCRLCDSQVTDILTNIERFKKFSAEISSIEKNIEDKFSVIENKIKKLENSNFQPEINSAVEKVMSEKKPSTDNEKELIKKKRNNLIYFNIPESSSENIEDKLKHDFGMLEQIYGRNYLKSENIENLFRVGKKVEEGNRPLIVKFSDRQTKEVFVEKSIGRDKDLILKYRNENIKISVSHDRTKNQREIYKNLRNELSRRKEAESNDKLIIRNGRIVEQNFPSETRGTKLTWANLVSRVR